MLWSAAAIVVVGVGTAAVSAASGTGSNVLSANDIRRELSSSTPAPSQSSGSSGPAGSVNPATSSAASQMVNTSAGSVVASCAQGQVSILRWTPASQYRTDDNVSRTPAASATITFESDTKDDVQVVLHCENGTVKFKTVVEADDHGGQRGATPSPTASDDHGGGGGGTDDPPGDDHGGKSGGTDDGANHH